MANSKTGEKSSTKVLKPNAFLALQIQSPDIRLRLIETAGKILDYDERLSGALEPVEKSHITLLVAHIAEEEVDLVASLVEQYVKQTLQPSGQPIHIDFQGLGTFGGRVVFAKPASGVQTLSRIAKDLSLVLMTAGIRVQVDKGYNPHLTLFKVGWRGRNACKSIPLEAFSSHQEVWFGQERVSSLQLLSMTKPKDANGYYHTLAEFSFADTGLQKQTNPEDWLKEHSMCCRHQAWTFRLSEAKKRTAAVGQLKKSVISPTVSEEQTVMEVASFESAATTAQPTRRDRKSSRRERLEEQLQNLEAEKAAARARTRRNVLRHYMIPAAVLTAGLLTGGAWMLRKRLR